MGKNYGKYYRPRNEEPKHEETKEVQTTEEVKAEESKVEYTTTKIGPNSIAQETIEIKKAKVVGAKLVNMRENPSIEANVIAKLPEGTEVLLGESNLFSGKSAWRHIAYGNKTGFMMAQFLKEIK